MINNLQNGDIISLDLDNWQMIGRKFEVLNFKFRSNSTAVELLVKDVVDESVFKCVVSRNQIELKEPMPS